MRSLAHKEGIAVEAVAGDRTKEAVTGDIRLRCPRCRIDISHFRCSRCGFELEIEGGIVCALTPERVAHYAQFMADYERIRNAEGRGCESSEFYLGLPYCDVTGRNSKQWRIRAQTYLCVMDDILTPSISTGARILDLGAGNCWLSFRLALAGYQPIAVDLLTNHCDGLAAARHYRDYLSDLFPRFRAEAQSLPFQSGQFTAVIFNASFHYVEDAGGALAEAFRCIKDDGMVIISDTPWYSNDASGKQMIKERRAKFLELFGTASAAMESIEYLTDGRLRALEEHLSIRWTIYSPGYGARWAMRPLFARLRGRREPARFRIYVATKVSG
jgi:ubiquinone/menaquinone biosynthesis C-methylase UbiE